MGLCSIYWITLFFIYIYIFLGGIEFEIDSFFFQYFQDIAILSSGLYCFWR